MIKLSCQLDLRCWASWVTSTYTDFQDKTASNTRICQGSRVASAGHTSKTLADRPHFKVWRTSDTSCLFVQVPERETKQWHPVYSHSLKMSSWLGMMQQDKATTWSAWGSLIGIHFPFFSPTLPPWKKVRMWFLCGLLELRTKEIVSLLKWAWPIYAQ